MAPHYSQIRIVLVDDSQEVLEILSEFLKGCGFTNIATYCSPKLFFIGERNQWQNIDFLMLDQNLQGITGLQLARALKGEGLLCKMALMSAQLPIAAGPFAEFCFMKPLVLDDLYKTLFNEFRYMFDFGTKENTDFLNDLK